MLTRERIKHFLLTGLTREDHIAYVQSFSGEVLNKVVNAYYLLYLNNENIPGYDYKIYPEPFRLEDEILDLTDRYFWENPEYEELFPNPDALTQLDYPYYLILYQESLSQPRSKPVETGDFEAFSLLVNMVFEAVSYAIYGAERRS